jgi:DNA-binding MarR family transcriptional regulator
MSPRDRTAASAATSLTEVGALVGDLMGLVHRRSAGGTLALMNEAGLTMAQMVALYVLDHMGPQSVTAIASFLNLSPAATSHLVDRLVGGGFVGRTEDQTDRRQKRVAITAAGRTLAARVHQERAREFASALALVTPELQRQFARILGRVVEQLRGAREDCTEPDRIASRWTGQAPSPEARARRTRAPKRVSKKEVE